MFYIKKSLTVFIGIYCIISTVFKQVYTMPTLITLPYEVDKIHSEDNLQCILNVLRQLNFQRDTNILPEIDHLYNHIQPGVQREIDMQTLLLQYFNLKPIKDRSLNLTWNPRKMIHDCKLNLVPAIERCKAAYGYQLDCEQVQWLDQEYNKAPFVTPKCPEGFQRYGCCKCLRKCDYSESVIPDDEYKENNQRGWTNTLYCLKNNKQHSRVESAHAHKNYGRVSKHRSIGINFNEWGIHKRDNGEYLYIENCPKDYERVGSKYCVAICP